MKGLLCFLLLIYCSFLTYAQVPAPKTSYALILYPASLVEKEGSFTESWLKH